MSVHGWKQLCLWSIKHSCLTDKERAEAFGIFGREWDAWCDWVVKTYEQRANALEVQL